MNTRPLTSILQCFNELITSDDFMANHRIVNAFTRSGKLSFSNLIYLSFNLHINSFWSYTKKVDTQMHHPLQ